MDHFDVAAVMDFLEQRLPEQEIAAYGVHMETCSICAEMYHFWWHFLSTITSERLVDAPERLINRCIGIFPGAPARNGFRQEFGRILFDSFFQPAPAPAIRGEHAARQIVIQMDEVDVHLRITGTHSKLNVQGQILPRIEGISIDGAHLTLLALGQTTRSTTSDHLGVFDFRDVPKATLVMSVELASSRFTGVVSVPEPNIGG